MSSNMYDSLIICMTITKIKIYLHFLEKDDIVLQLDTSCCNKKYFTEILCMDNFPYWNENVRV